MVFVLLVEVSLRLTNSHPKTFAVEIIVKSVPPGHYKVVSSKMIIDDELTYLVKGLEGRTYGTDIHPRIKAAAGIRSMIATDAKEMINSWQQGWKADDVIVTLFEACSKCNSICAFPINSDGES